MEKLGVVEVAVRAVGVVVEEESVRYVAAELVVVVAAAAVGECVEMNQHRC